MGARKIIQNKVNHLNKELRNSNGDELKHDLIIQIELLEEILDEIDLLEE